MSSLERSTNTISSRGDEAESTAPVSPELLAALVDECDSTDAKLVAHHLAAVRRATSGELKSRLDMKLISLLPILERLEAKGLLFRNDGCWCLDTDVVSADEAQ